LLPWDEDIDLCVTLTEVQILKAHPGKTFQIAGDFLWNINPNFLDRSTRNRVFGDLEEQNKIDARLVDRATGVFLDVTALAELHPGVVSTKCPHHYPTDWIYPTPADTFEGTNIYVPRNPEAVLVREYGVAAI
jgi:hypothetical protein